MKETNYIAIESVREDMAHMNLATLQYLLQVVKAEIRDKQARLFAECNTV